MKRLTVTLIGTVIRGATRSFVVEVPDHVNPATLDSKLLESLADQARIHWDFGTESIVELTDHIIEEETAISLDGLVPTIPFNERSNKSKIAE